MDPLVADAPSLQSAHVTLDALHTGVMWGWYVTMNMWAKSVSTGAVLVGAYMMHRHAHSQAFYRRWVPIIGFVFVNLTLLFTVLDLHQMFRFWHQFAHPHLTSAINIGAWLLTAYTGVLALLLFALWKKQDALWDRLFWPTLVLAFFSTIYTAALMGQASAREIWQTPAEVAQMLVAATLAGSATFLLFGRRTDDESLSLAWILGLSALVALTIFSAEVVFAPQKSEEAEYVIHTLMSGNLRTLFLAGLTFGFVVPGVLVGLSVRAKQPVALKLAAVSGLAGLWMVKHAWLIAPQLLPLS
ncbi:MAG: NrfD/PsrC family molybdoenzyme membrane anchor subunit [Myxococcota bacterium]